MFHYDEIGVEVPDKGLKILKAEALNLYRVEDYLRSEGSDVDLEFYVDEVGTSVKATLNGIIDTKVKFASVDAESKYADFTFNIMERMRSNIPPMWERYKVSPKASVL